MKERKNGVFAAFSAIISFFCVLTVLLFKSSINKNVLEGLDIKLFTLYNLFIFIIFNIFFNVLFRYVDKKLCKIQIYNSNMDYKSRKFFWKVFFTLILAWSVWFWLYFPGTGMNDTINCITSYQNNNQTFVYQMIIYYGINGLTKLTHDMTTAYAILTIVQMVLMSLIISWVIDWLKKKNIKQIYMNFLILYYALMPVVADYSITLVKDTLFGACMMGMIPILYELLNDRGQLIKNRNIYSALLIDLLGITVLRSNGKYVAVIVLVILMFIRLNNIKKFLTILLILVVVNLGINFGEKSIIQSDAEFRESIGVPLAQIGAVLTVDGYISEQNKQVLNELLPINIWRESHRFSFVDIIKYNNNFNNQWLNDNKGKFIKVWASILRDNLAIYIKAYFCHTYGFWNLSPFNITSIDYSQSYFTRINNNTSDDSYWGEFCTVNKLHNSKIGPGTVREQMDIIFKLAFKVNLILGAGVMFWICMWFVIELIVNRKYKMCCIFLPTIINWSILMIAAPISFVYRYSFYLVLSLPVLFLATLMQMKDYEKKYELD